MNKHEAKGWKGELARAIKEGRFTAYQAVLAQRTSPRLSTNSLPLVDLNGCKFWDGVVLGYSDLVPSITHFTDTRASKILATPMRDAANGGPVLRQAHWQTGQYLALQTLPDLLGVEEHMIQHVQGHQVAGSRVAQQDKTLIVALMRGGEPMALGVNEVLPSASFLHAHLPSDINSDHVKAMSTIVLVDSVVNSGQTVVDFVHRFEKLSQTLCTVVIAGVVQSEAITKLEVLQSSLKRQKLHLVALRLSTNKFTGRGGTDTGNRLFHTEKLK